MSGSLKETAKSVAIKHTEKNRLRKCKNCLSRKISDAFPFMSIINAKIFL